MAKKRKRKMSIEKQFENLPRLIQVLLLFLPFVNWIKEIVVRWSHAARKDTLFKYLIAILVTFFGLFIGWVDAIWCLLFKSLLLCN